MKKTIHLLLAVLMVVSLFAGCAAPAAQPGEATAAADASADTAAQAPAEEAKKLVVMTISNQQNEFIIGMGNSFKQVGEEQGYEVRLLDANTDPTVQLSQIESAITEGAVAIFLEPCSFDGLTSGLQMAKEAVTDDEKLASFKRVRQLRDEVLAHVDSLLTGQLELANECATAYQAVELKEKEFNRVDPLGDKTRSYIAQGNWQFCRFYADNAVVAVEQFAACQGNLVLTQSLESSLQIQHPYANEARTYAAQQNWLFCAFYAKEAIDAMLPLMPTPPP